MLKECETLQRSSTLMASTASVSLASSAWTALSDPTLSAKHSDNSGSRPPTTAKFFKEDYIAAHLELPGRDMIVMLTYDRTLLIRSDKLRSNGRSSLQKSNHLQGTDGHEYHTQGRS